MTVAIIDEEKKPVRLHESVFWNKDDPRRQYLYSAHKGQKLISAGGSYSPEVGGGEDIYFPQASRKGHEIDMRRDSYIWCFTGVRGSGKSMSMTYFALACAVRYHMRLVANYPIECLLVRMNGKVELVTAESLDLYKLLCFDNDYKDCLLLIDEAPDIISHMASMTWKNRLLNIFVRQLRKNHNSLFLGAQEFSLIDKSMRWQTDILAECNDASRRYGWGSDYRGKCVLLKLKDNSGMWTGESYDNAIMRQRHQFVRDFRDPAVKLQLYPRVLWGDETHKPAYDSYYVQDVWESLKKVDMTLMTYQVGQTELDKSDYIQRATPFLNSIMESDTLIVDKKEFYAALELTNKEKNALSKRLANAGAKMYGHGESKFNFTDFSLNAFMKAV